MQNKKIWQHLSKMAGFPGFREKHFGKSSDRSPKGTYLTAFVKICLGGLAFAWVFYVLAILILLDTPLLQALTKMNSDDFELRYKFAWSVTPGWVHIYGAKMRIQDENIDFNFSIPWVKGKFDLLALKDRTVSLKSLQIQGIVFNARMKTPEEKKAWPKIPNLKSLEERRQKIWRTQFEGVEITDVDTIDISGIILKGKIRIQGQFAVWPSVEVIVGPAQLQLEQGSLGIQKSDHQIVPFGENLKGGLIMNMTKFIVPETSGPNVLRHLNVTAQFDGGIKDVRFLNVFLCQAPSVRLDGGAGSFEMKTQVSNGVIKHPSFMHISSQDVSVNTFDYLMGGSGDVDWKTFVANAKEGAALSVALPKFQMTRKSFDAVLIKGADLVATASSMDLDLVSPFDDLVLRLQIPKATAPELKSFHKFLSGGAELSADLRAFAGTVDSPGAPGHLQLKFQKTGFHYNDATMHANGGMEAVFSGINLKTMTGNLVSAKVDLQQVRIKGINDTQEKAQAEWWMNLALKDASFSMKNGRKMHGHADIKMKDLVLPLKAVGVEPKLSGIQKFILPRGEAKASADLEANEQFFQGRNIDASTSGLGLKGWLGVFAGKSRGALLLSVLHLLSVGVTIDASKVDTTFPATEKWLKEQFIKQGKE